MRLWRWRCWRRGWRLRSGRRRDHRSGLALCSKALDVVKLGAYFLSSDILERLSFFAGAAFNKSLERDLFFQLGRKLGHAAIPAALRVHDRPWSYLHIPAWLAALATALPLVSATLAQAGGATSQDTENPTGLYLGTGVRVVAITLAAALAPRGRSASTVQPRCWRSTMA